MSKVLIISYYWPPAGGPGVQRWLKFVKYLPEFDIIPEIFIPENPHYPIKDASLIADIPAGLVCHRHKIKEPYFLARLIMGKAAEKISSGIIKEQSQSFVEKLALWIRGNLFIPDARKSWISPASRKILKILDQKDIQTIITTGPPHSLHLIGLKVKQQTGVKWVADFRDPWTSIGYHGKLKLGKKAQKKHRELESKVLRGADKIIATSRTTLEEFKNITDKPISVITNGYDSEKIVEEQHIDEKFTMSYIGSLLSGRNPVNLWKVLADLIEDIPGFKEDIELKFIGTVSEEVLHTLEHYGLKDFVSLIPYVGHEDALRFQSRSQLLLLFEIDSAETKAIIPGKLFEYMAAKRPVLAIGPQEWEAGELIEATNSGVCFCYDDDELLKKQLIAWYDQYKSGSLMVNPNSIEQYSRRALTARLAQELKWE